MTRLVRNIIIIIGLVLTLGFFNLQIKAAQSIKDDGEVLFLKLRPVDPRELMMGDFMALAYDEAAFPNFDVLQDRPSGTIVLDLDENRVGTFARIDGDAKIKDGQIRVKYIRLFGGKVSYGGQRFYFQEGTAEIFEEAEYGVFKVDSSGRAILSDMADENFKILSAPD